MFTKNLLRLLALVGMLALTSITAPHVSAQEDPGAFPLVSFSAFCEPGYFGPFDGCTPWEGVTVWMTSADGAFSSSCTTAGAERAASCTLDVPFGSVITASIDPAIIPAGYVLEGAVTQEFVIPDGPPEGVFSGPSFVLLPAEVPVEEIPDEPIDEVPSEPIEEDGFPLGAATAYCDPGYMGVFEGCTPWEGVTVTFVSADGSFSASCVTAGTDRAAGCGVDVPFGSTITASIDPTLVSIDWVLEGSFEQTFVIPDGPPEGEFGGPVFVLLPYEGGEDTHDRPADDPVDTSVTSPTGDAPVVLSLPSTGTGQDAASTTPYFAFAVAGIVICLAGVIHVKRKS